MTAILVNTGWIYNSW